MSVFPVMTMRFALTLAALAMLLAGCRDGEWPLAGASAGSDEVARLEAGPEAAPAFGNYPPFEEIAPEAVAPDLGTHPRAAWFREDITEGAERGTAFAGHLAVASWDCGTACRQYAFVDARTGRVIWGPETSYGAAYVPHSRLFVANPPENLPRDEADRPLDPTARPEFYVWDGERLVLLRGEAQG